MNASEAKARLRTELRARVAAMTPGERADASSRVRDHLASSGPWRDARVVMLYASDGTEPDLDGLIADGTAAGKTVCVPRVDWESKRLIPVAVASAGVLRPDRHGIRTPASGAEVPPESVGLVVTPGVGFDRSGRRLGRGGGFYDRFLAARSGHGPMRSIGACFAAQVVGRIPADGHDRWVDGLVTEAGLEILVARDTEGPA